MKKNQRNFNTVTEAKVIQLIDADGIVTLVLLQSLECNNRRNVALKEGNCRSEKDREKKL